jgi:hypothetical protein
VSEFSAAVVMGLSELEPRLGGWCRRVVTTAMPPPSPRPWEGRSSRRRLAGVGVAAVIVVAVLAVGWMVPRPRSGPTRPAPASATSSSAPALRPSTTPRPSGHGALPLGGVPLVGPTGLRLLIADVPAPFVLEVDQGTIQPITGLPTEGERGVTVLPVGNDALVVSFRLCNRCRPDASVSLVRRGSATATWLNTALQAVPSHDGQGLWLLSSQGTSRCTIREVGLDGRPRRAARQVSCRTGLVAELSAGLLVSAMGAGGRDWHGALLGSDGAVVRVGDPQAQPVVGNLVLSGADRHTPLVLHDVGTGARSRLRWPSRPDYGLGEVTGDPNGRLAIVEFAKYSPEHRLDLWVLDTTTRRWQHLPDMPARMVPKATDVRWTTDGRVVLLSSNLLAVWRPGEPRLAVGRVRSSRQPGGNFLIW